MSWNNNVPSREEYTQHYLGTFPLMDLLNPLGVRRAIRRSAPLLSRLYDLSKTEHGAAIKEDIHELSGEIAEIQVELYSNGTFTTAIIHGKQITAVGTTRRSNRDQPSQEFANQLATRRAFQGLFQQIDADHRNTPLGVHLAEVMDRLEDLMAEPPESVGLTSRPGKYRVPSYQDDGWLPNWESDETDETPF